MKSPTGSLQLLDGGTLDLGLVRDSTLNTSNDFQMFSETFKDSPSAVARHCASARPSPRGHRAGGRGGGVVAGTDRLRPCGVKTRLGKPCRGVAIRGSSRCWMHGGSAPQVRRKAAQNVVEATAVERARRYGTPRKTTAPDALQKELERTQGRVDGVGEQVAEKPDDPGLLSVYQSERARLARLSHQIISSRPDERRTVLAERSIDSLEVAMTGILRELGSGPESSYVRGVVARHLREAITSAGESTTDVDADPSDDRPRNIHPLPVAF